MGLLPSTLWNILIRAQLSSVRIIREDRHGMTK